jgi:hypothetical protein
MHGPHPHAPWRAQSSASARRGAEHDARARIGRLGCSGVVPARDAVVCFTRVAATLTRVPAATVTADRAFSAAANDTTVPTIIGGSGCAPVALPAAVWWGQRRTTTRHK